MYHVIVEATLAQPGQHFITDYLTQRDLLPGFRAGMHNVSLDEQRHIGFGVKLLRDLRARGSRGAARRSPTCCARCSRTRSACSSRRAGTRATSSASASRSRRSTRRARGRSRPSSAPPGCRSSRCPGRSVMPIDLPPRERAERGLAMLRVRLPRRAERAARARPGGDARCCSTASGATSTSRRAPDGPFVAPVGLHRRRAVAPAARQRRRPPRRRAASDARRPRAALPLRRLGRRGRRAARPAAGDGDRAAAAARHAAHAVVGARHLRGVIRAQPVLGGRFAG